MQHLQDATVCVATKGLTHLLSPLDATFTKNTGGWGPLWLARNPRSAPKAAVAHPFRGEVSLFRPARTPNQKLDAHQTGQLRGADPLSLHQHLEPFPHPFGMDQRLELQPRFRALRLGLSVIVEVGKFISLAERQQKGRL